MLACQVYSQNFYVFVTIYSTRRADKPYNLLYARASRYIRVIFMLDSAQSL